jgi:hypothetical protein
MKSTVILSYCPMSINITTFQTQFVFKGRLQSVCKQSLCLHFGVQNIELYSTTIFSCLIYSIINDQDTTIGLNLQEHKMK